MAPKKLAEECYKFYDNIDAAVEYGNKMLVSDAVCAAILLNAAVESAIVNVKINLNSLKDLPIAKEIEKEMKELEENSLKRKEKICSTMNN